MLRRLWLCEWIRLENEMKIITRTPQIYSNIITIIQTWYLVAQGPAAIVNYVSRNYLERCGWINWCNTIRPRDLKSIWLKNPIDCYFESSALLTFAGRQSPSILPTGRKLKERRKKEKNGTVESITTALHSFLSLRLTRWWGMNKQANKKKKKIKVSIAAVR